MFTIDEANALIPRVREMFLEIQNIRGALSALEPKIQPAREKAAEGGGSAYGSLFVQLIQNFSRQIREIETTGVLIKDLEVGLFDFPHQLGDRVVLLCWKHGETEIDWYHDVDTGFADRKPLPKDPGPIV
ncbi:MAG: DUF2203 domain-containing protein [Acidobacteria bacterium]|nr:DUF2203 domain-containing protein [Acidobacteriota bacterium]